MPTEQTTVPQQTEGPDPVRKWTLIMLVLAGILLIWYLAADRLTPCTSQARVHALVVPIASEVSGIVAGVDVRNNQHVKKGQILFRIEPEQYQLALKNAQASLQSAQASLQKAEQNTHRMRRIKQQDPGAISDRRLESAEATLESARGKLKSAIANLNKAQLNLEHTTIHAPEEGVVTNVGINAGHFAAAGKPLMTFIAVRDVWLRADFTENNLGHIRPGETALISFDMLPGRVIEGKVRELGFGVAVDKTQPGALPTIRNDRSWVRTAQRFPVLIDFPYPGDDKELTLRLGSQASVIVLTGNHPLLNVLARCYIRILSILSYAW